MLYNNDIIVFDFETGGVNPKVCPAIQIAGLVIDSRRLEPYPDGVFSSMMRPPDNEMPLIGQKALDINKKTIKEIEEAPAQKEVWENFSKFVKKFSKGRGFYNNLIPAGKYIRGFDLIISERLCRSYGPWDKTDDCQDLFHRKVILDADDMLYMWFEGTTDELKNLKMDTIKPYLGMKGDSITKGHDALQDVKDTAAIIIKFLKLHRGLFPKIKFRNSFA